MTFNHQFQKVRIGKRASNDSVLANENGVSFLHSATKLMSPLKQAGNSHLLFAWQPAAAFTVMPQLEFGLCIACCHFVLVGLLEGNLL